MTMLAALSGQLMADEYGYMVFTLSDGTTQSITASGLSLSFADGSLTAQNGSKTLTIPLSNLKTMAFSKDGQSGVDTVTTDDGDEEIYDLQGHRVTRAQMRKGVYIVKTKNRTYKVSVR